MTSITDRVLEALLETTTDYAIISMDLDGLVTSWSEGAHAILGWTAEEMTGRPASIFFTQEDRVRGVPQAEMEAALAHGRGNDERWHLKRDGTRFWASGEMLPMRDTAGGVHGLIKVLRDRTAQRLAEERQRADAEFLRSVLAASGDCIKVLDLDGRVQFMNEGGQRVMEVSDFNVVRGCPWPDFWRDAGNQAAADAVATARAGGIGKFQGLADTFKGTPKYWDVQVTPILGAEGQPEKLLAVSRDITGTRAAELALRDAQSLNTLILESSRDCIVVLDLDGHSLFVSRGGIVAMEIDDVRAILGQSWLSDWTGDDAEAARHAVAEARAGRIGRFQAFRRTHKGTPKWWDMVISPLPGPDGRPERLVSIGRDITERREAQQRLRISEERLQLALGASDMVAIWDADLLAGTIYGDANFARLHGLAQSAAEAGVPIADAFQRVHRDDVARFRAELAAVGTGADVLELEHRLVQADGSARWVVARGRVVRDGAGTAVRLPGALVDVTERRLAAERQALLMEELAHRVKNTLAVVQSIAQQTLRGDGDIAIARDAFCARLAALGAAHDVLLQESWTRAGLRGLVNAALQVHAPAGADGARRVLINGPEITLGPRAALAFALMLHELGTNAVKYGALANAHGRVEVSWSKRHAAEGVFLHFIWSEHDGPPVAPPERRGFGTRLIERGLAAELGAAVKLDYAAGGVVLTLDASLAAMQPA